MIQHFDMITMEHCTMMIDKKTERSCKGKKIEDLKICSIDKRVFGYCQSNSWSSNVSSVFFILKITFRRRKASRTRPHFAKMKSSQPVLRIIVILKMFNVPWSLFNQCTACTISDQSFKEAESPDQSIRNMDQQRGGFPSFKRHQDDNIDNTQK